MNATGPCSVSLMAGNKAAAPIREWETGKFAFCTGLKEVVIPSGVTALEDYSFSWCAGLTDLSLSESVTAIGGAAFKGCERLKLHVKENSYAHDWAVANGVPFALECLEARGERRGCQT